MEYYQKEFIEFLLKKEALKIGNFELRSGRISPYFINTGVFDDGESISDLGGFYAKKITDSLLEEFDIIFGPAYKGIPLSLATVIALNYEFGVNKGYSFNRKEAKGHGEATKQDIQKNWLIGHKIENGNKILLLDDVFTTGDTKYESINLLNSVADNLKYPRLIIAVDRQEISPDGVNAIKQFEDQTGIPVDPIISIIEIIEYLGETEKITSSDKQNLEDYLRRYGTKEAKERLK